MLRKSLIGIIGTLILLSAAGSYGAQVGDPAPDFTYNTLEHGQISLSDYSGKIVYLYFLGYS